MSIYEKSIAIILENQTEEGAYLASPNFPTYRYSWFRDGSFIAHSMDLVGEHSSARAFHNWVSSVIVQRSDQIEDAVAKVKSGTVLAKTDYLHTRYDPKGEESDGSTQWPNHQLDGFGTWLWALSEHVKTTSTTPSREWIAAADLLAAYLTSLWDQPCYDSWEEFPDQVHTYTLAAIFAGLRAHEELTGTRHSTLLIKIGHRIELATADGHFVKYGGATAVDANLVGLAVPYRVVDSGSPIMRATVARIEETLGTGGGVRRYPTDTYYGGGEWILLSCWLAWYYLETGESNRAHELLDWVVNQQTEDGYLPEQVPHFLNEPDQYRPWVDRWGEIASPLLWSHAMYLICAAKLGEPAADPSGSSKGPTPSQGFAVPNNTITERTSLR